MKFLFNKLLTILVWIKFPKIPSYYRFFIRFYYIHKLIQIKYFIKDYVIKKPYKIICFNGEFSPEMKFVLPFAYWHYKNGTLLKTISTKNTKELYFFSKNHEEIFGKREWNDFLFDLAIPNSEDHNIKYNYQKWESVPLKQFYKNDLITFNKPILVIANKYNKEWEKFPVNFFDLDLLENLFKKLKNKYQVIYNRPSSKNIINDNSEILDLNEEKLILEKFPDIIFLEKFYELNKDKANNYNHFQLLVYSNCENFLSVHGGTATFASYFGGTNIIYSKKGHEAYFKEFETIYPKLSGAKCIHASTSEQLLEAVNKNFL